MPPTLKHMMRALSLSNIPGKDCLSWMLPLYWLRPIITGIEGIEWIVDATDSAMLGMMKKCKAAKIRYCYNSLNPVSIQPIRNLGRQIDVAPDDGANIRFPKFLHDPGVSVVAPDRSIVS